MTGKACPDCGAILHTFEGMIAHRDMTCPAIVWCDSCGRQIYADEPTKNVGDAVDLFLICPACVSERDELEAEMAL